MGKEQIYEGLEFLYPDEPIERVACESFSIREVDPLQQDLQGTKEQILMLYNHPLIQYHFLNPPKTEGELDQILDDPNNHVFVARNREGAVIGTFTIFKESEDVAVDLKVAVNPKYWGNKIGNVLEGELLRTVFEEYDCKVCKTAISETPGWEFMYRACLANGYEEKEISYKQKDLGVKAIVAGNLYDAVGQLPQEGLHEVSPGLGWKIVQLSNEKNEMYTFTEIHAMIGKSKVHRMELSKEKYFALKQPIAK